MQQFYRKTIFLSCKRLYSYPWHGHTLFKIFSNFNDITVSWFGKYSVEEWLTMTGCGMSLPRKQISTFAFPMFISFTAIYNNKHYHYNNMVVLLERREVSHKHRGSRTSQGLLTSQGKSYFNLMFTVRRLIQAT